ncbi:unnamed protein product [Mytilus coruscus]|uniref:MEGF10_11 n=1 Tax=Mytilus coruscus TaxID=42192 RepID=A0A6J8DT56_MYTCO|nr:unnamed protein product [Mytilus coruscus]
MITRGNQKLKTNKNPFQIKSTEVRYFFKICFSGEIEKVCCDDYEANGNDCIACSKGYTSKIGQHCMLCPKDTYGERCRHECSCSGLEICDHAEGCVEVTTTNDTSEFTTSSCLTGYTSERGQNCISCPKNTYGEKCKSECSCLAFEMCDKVKGCVGFPPTTDSSVHAPSNDMTLTWDLDFNTNGVKSDNSNEVCESFEYGTRTKQMLPPGTESRCIEPVNQ